MHVFIVIRKLLAFKTKISKLISSLFFKTSFKQDEVSWIEWKKALSDALVESQHTYTVTEKASKIYGVDVKRITVQE